jgi:hypothetical protein
MLVMIVFFLTVLSLLALDFWQSCLASLSMFSLSLGVAAHGPAPERGLITAFPRELPETFPFPLLPRFRFICAPFQLEMSFFVLGAPSLDVS